MNTMHPVARAAVLATVLIWALAVIGAGPGYWALTFGVMFLTAPFWAPVVLVAGVLAAVMVGRR